MSGEVLLDAALVRRRQLALGVSERELAKRLGVTGQVIGSLERARSHADVTVELLVGLADALALTIAELLPRHAAAAPSAERPATPDPAESGPVLDAARDAAAVGALLSTEGVLMPVTTLAAVLRWPPERVEAALDVLAGQLPTVGQRLHRLGNDVKTVAAAVDAPEMSALTRRSFARRGMALAQARMLRDVQLGRVTGAETGNAERVTLATLVNAGLVVFDAGDARGTRPALSDDVAFSLSQ